MQSMSEWLSNTLEIVGWLAVAAASWFICPWLVLIWFGLTLMLIGYVAGPE